MSVDGSNKLTRYTSAVTVVTADVMNSLFGGEHGFNYDLDEFHPLVAGHVHDGKHADGHASKVLLTNGEHVRGYLSHANLGGTDGTTPAVQAANIQCYPDNIYGDHGGGNAIPHYTVDDDDNRCYYLDLSMTVGGDDTHIQYNKDGEFAGDDGLVYDYQNIRVGIGASSPEAKLTVESSDNTRILVLKEADESIYGPDIWLEKSRSSDIVQGNDYLGTIAARGWDGDSYETAGAIQFRVEGTPLDDDVASELRLITRPSGVSGIDWDAHTRLVVKSDGSVGIGTDSPTNKFEVVGGDSSFCEGKVMLYGSPQNVSPSGCAVNDMVAFFDGDIDVTGNIDPTGIIFTEVDPDLVPTKEGVGAIFVSDGSQGLDRNKLYYKDKDQNIIELGSPTEPSSPLRSVQFNSFGAFSGDESLLVGEDLSLGVGMHNGMQPGRKLHIADSNGDPPVRITSLPRGSGHLVVWDEYTGDLFHEPRGSHMEPRVKTWDPTGGDIVIGTEDVGAFVIVAGEWNGTGRIVIPEIPPVVPEHTGQVNPPVPPDPHGPYHNTNSSTSNLTYGEWVSGDNFYIKNMTTYGRTAMYRPLAEANSYVVNASSANLSSASYNASATTSSTGAATTDNNSINASANLSSASYNASATTSSTGAATTDNNSSNDTSNTSSTTLSAGAVAMGASRNLSLSGQTSTGSSYVPIVVVGNGAGDTLDGEPLSSGYALAPRNAIQLCCISHTDSTHWYLASHYHPQEYTPADLPPVAVIRVTMPNPDNSGETIVVNDQSTIVAGPELTFDGSGSYDPDGSSIEGFSWTITADGAEVTVTNKSVFQVGSAAFEGKILEATLVVTSGGLSSVGSTFRVTVSDSNQAPVASISGDTSGEDGQGVFVSGRGSSDPDNDSLSFSWSLQSQPSNSSISLDDFSTDEITFYPDAEGQYIVALVVNDGSLDSNIATHTVNITASNQTPVASFMFKDESGNSIDKINLGGSVYITPGFSDPDGDPLTVSWSGSAQDNSSGAEDIPIDTSSFDITGNPFAWTPEIGLPTTITLMVSDGEESAEFSRSIDVNVGPVASFVYNNSNGSPDGSDGYTGDSITFTSTSTDQDGGIASYSWTVESGAGDFNFSGTNSSEAQFATDVAGEYTIKLVVADDDGAEGTASHTIMITEEVTAGQPPVAIITGDRVGVSPGVNLLIGDTSYDPEGEDIVSYSWNLESAPSSSEATLSAYSEGDVNIDSKILLNTDIAGEYIVSLIVNDGELDSLKSTFAVTTSAQTFAPIASFNMDPSTAEIGEEVTLTSTSNDVDGTIQSYNWQATGGSNYSITTTTPGVAKFASNEAGSFTISLTVTDDDGLQGTASQDIVIVQPNAMPVADFNVSSQTPAIGEAVSVTSTSYDTDGSIVGYSWQATGPGGHSFDSSDTGATNFTASTEGDYTISLTVTDDGGLESVESKTLTVIDPNSGPVIGTIAVTGATIIGNRISLAAPVSDSDGTIKSYEWSLDSSSVPPGASWQLTPSGVIETPSSADQVGATFVADKEGDYSIGVLVTDDDDASSSKSIIVSIRKGDNHPDWQDNPGGYEHTATIASGIVTDDGSTNIADMGDLFAAFDKDGNVRGVGVQLVAPFGDYQGQIIYEMQLRSNSADDLLTFKYYDASEDAVKDIGNTYAFIINDVIGDVNSPMFFEFGMPNVHYVVNLDQTGNSQLFVFEDTISNLQPGVEIGIFDEAGVTESCLPENGCQTPSYGETLVGSGVWSGEQLNISGILSVDLSGFNGPILNGAVETNSLLLKVWNNSDQTESIVSATFSQGSGIFGEPLTVISGVAETVREDQGGAAPRAGDISLYTEIALGKVINFLSNISDSDGTIATFEWAVGSAPSGAQISLLPSGPQVFNKSEGTVGGSIQVDTPGDYEIVLRVVDNEGLEGRASKVITVPPSLNFDGGGSNNQDTVTQN